VGGLDRKKHMEFHQGSAVGTLVTPGATLCKDQHVVDAAMEKQKMKPEGRRHTQDMANVDAHHKSSVRISLPCITYQSRDQNEGGRRE
jgi:hypothetical protein